MGFKTQILLNPDLLGTNSDEGAFNLVGYLLGIISLEEVDRRWDELGPLILFARSLDETSPEDVRIAREVKDFYFKEVGGEISETTRDQFVKMMGDHMFYSGIHRTIRYIY